MEDRDYTRVKFEYENEFGDITTLEETCHEVGDYQVDDMDYLVSEFVKFAKACTFHRNTIANSLIEYGQSMQEDE